MPQAAAFEAPALSPLLAAAAMAHGDSDGGGWLAGSTPGAQLDEEARAQREHEREQWKERWKEEWRRSKRYQQRSPAVGPSPLSSAPSVLPRAQASGGFVPRQLALDRASDHDSESEFELSPAASSDRGLSPVARSPGSRRPARSRVPTRASGDGGGGNSGELVREWSELYRMTSKRADLGVEATGKKAQYENYFANRQNKIGGSGAVGEADACSCGRYLVGRLLVRMCDNPWAWLKGVPLSLLWTALRCFLVVSTVHTLVVLHLQWYVGEAVEYASALETLARMALVFNGVAYWCKREEPNCPQSQQQEKPPRSSSCSEDGWELVKTWVFQPLVQPVCAPAVVLIALGFLAWVPAVIFVGSKTRNWDWADEFVNRTRASNFTLEQLSAAIGGMKKSRDEGGRAIGQTEQMFVYGLGLCGVAYAALWCLRKWLKCQLRRLNALKHWKELSRTFWDDVFAQAFKKYDRDNDNSITKTELEMSVKSALGLSDDAELGFEQKVAIRDMFRQGDVDSDGTVSAEEFQNMMYSTLSGDHAQHTLREQFNSAFDRNNDGHTAESDVQYVMGMLKEHTDESFENLSDIASSMVDAAGTRTQKGITYEQWARMMVRNDNMERTICRENWLHSPGAWFYRDAHHFVTRWLLQWQLDLSSNLPRVYLPLPLILPVAFAPFVKWIWHLTQLCSELVNLGQLAPDLAEGSANSLECQFEFFQFDLPTGNNPLISFVLRTLLGLDLPARMDPFPGLPLTNWLQYLHMEVWVFLTESVLGTSAVIATALWEYYQQRELDQEEEIRQAKAKQDAQSNNLMSEVSFSLCLLSSPEPLQENQSTYKAAAAAAAAAAKVTLTQATLFEVKLKDLVKDQSIYSEAVHLAAEKTTSEYPFLHCLPKNMWGSIRGYILNELSGRFSGGYVAEELALNTTKGQFHFGLAHEPSRVKKLRVIVASDNLLKRVYEMVRRGEEPTLSRDYHKQRWKTVKNMAHLYHDKKNWTNNPLREITLCLPAEDKLSSTSSFASFGNERTLSEHWDDNALQSSLSSLRDHRPSSSPVAVRVAPKQRTPPADPLRLTRILTT